jgi:hypothetical protein
MPVIRFCSTNIFQKIQVVILGHDANSIFDKVFLKYYLQNLKFLERLIMKNLIKLFKMFFPYLDNFFQRQLC